MEVTINQLMEMTGKSFRTIKAKIQGLTPVRSDGRADHFDCKEALEKIYELDQLALESLREQKGRADKIEIEVQKLRGELIPIGTVAETLSRQLTNFRTQVRSLPSKLAKPLSMVTDPFEVQTQLGKAIDEFLSELTADADYQLEADRVKSNRPAVVPDSSEGNEAEPAVESGGMGRSVPVLEPRVEQHPRPVANRKRRSSPRPDVGGDGSSSKEDHSDGADSASED